MAIASLPPLMKAWQYVKLGGNVDSAMKMVSDRALPVPSKGQVLVEVQSLAVNPAEWKVQSGVLWPLLPRTLPFVPGADVAGIVRAVGDEVQDMREGDRVFGAVNFMKGGGYAQYALLDHQHAARVPAGLSADVACCLPIAAGTALQSIRVKAPNLDGSYSGRILVANASGGVGHYAVQIARLTGAHVTATAGARNLELVRSLGAHDVLDYKSEAGRSLATAANDDGFDLVVDASGSPGLPWPVLRRRLRKGGLCVHLTPNLSVMARATWQSLMGSDPRVTHFMVEHNRADLDLLARLSDEGRLKTVIEEKLPFAKANVAWKKSIEGHVVGKLVLQD